MNLGSILTFPIHIYYLAFSALYTLNTRFQFSIDPSTPFSQSSFLGIHLCTSINAAMAGWTGYEEQSSHYLDLAASHVYPLVYVASENATSVVQFTAEAAALSPPVPVITKEDLLNEDQLKELRSLTWDQAALIDYIMLRSAGFFAGMVESSFTWNIAMARAATRGGKEALCRDNIWEVGSGISWQDECSEIMGADPSEFKGRMWP